MNLPPNPIDTPENRRVLTDALAEIGIARNWSPDNTFSLALASIGGLLAARFGTDDVREVLEAACAYLFQGGGCSVSIEYFPDTRELEAWQPAGGAH